jgi:response regulator RpfG family c-di-GMP phosphodiesterase
MATRKVLVLDDDSASLAALRAELSPGYAVIEAENFLSAVGLLYAHVDLTAVLAHMNTKRGPAGAEFMVEVERLQPRCWRILYSRWAVVAPDARQFAHEFVAFPWEAGSLRALVRKLTGAPPITMPPLLG